MGVGIGGWIFVSLAVVAAVIWLVAIYNGLVTLRNRFRNAFSQIDVQLKRRYDLIPKRAPWPRPRRPRRWPPRPRPTSAPPASPA